MILLASAAVILSITPILKDLLQRLSHKSVIVTERILIPVEDTQGNIVYDSDGNPILQWIERAKLLEETHHQDETTVQIKGPLHLVHLGVDTYGDKSLQHLE